MHDDLTTLQGLSQQRIRDLGDKHGRYINDILSGHEQKVHYPLPLPLPLPLLFFLPKQMKSLQLQHQLQLEPDQEEEKKSCMTPDLLDLQKDLEGQRDRVIQADIRRMERDHIRTERQIKQMKETELKKLIDANDREEAALQGTVQRLTEEVGDLVLKKEGLMAALKELKSREEEQNREVAELQAQLAVYREGVHAINTFINVYLHTYIYLCIHVYIYKYKCNNKY